MKLWRIYPVAAPSDSRWQGRQRWQEVIVRATSPAFARIVARRLEMQGPHFSLGNESHGLRSGFLDEKLYWVSRLSEEEAAAFPAGSLPEVLAARLDEEPEAEPLHTSQPVEREEEAAAP